MRNTLIPALASLVLLASCGGSGSKKDSPKDSTSGLTQSAGTDSTARRLAGFCPPVFLNDEMPKLDFCGSLHSNACIYSFTKSNLASFSKPGFFVIGDTHKPAFFDEQISIQDLAAIYNTIAADPQYKNPGGLNYVAALMMSYGINKTDDSLKIIYSPVILQNLTLNPVTVPSTASPSVIQQITGYNMALINSKNWIVNKENGVYKLIPVTDADTSDMATRFRNNIRFLEEGSTIKYRKYKSDPSFNKGDIKSTFMTFQQIFRMYCDRVGQVENMQDRLTMLPIGTKYTGTGHKMHVVIYYDQLVDDNPATDPPREFVNLAADASQMCPPKCSNGFGPQQITRDLKVKYNK